MAGENRLPGQGVVNAQIAPTQIFGMRRQNGGRKGPRIPAPVGLSDAEELLVRTSSQARVRLVKPFTLTGSSLQIYQAVNHPVDDVMIWAVNPGSTQLTLTLNLGDNGDASASGNLLLTTFLGPGNSIVALPFPIALGVNDILYGIGLNAVVWVWGRPVLT